jgi:hypothetical protein
MGKRELVMEFREALKAHGPAYRSGDKAELEAANDRIGKARDAIDLEWQIDTAGILGNETVLKILIVGN